MDALWSQLPDDFKSLVFDKLCAFGNNAANAVAVRFALPWDSEKAAALLAKLQGLFDVQSAVAFLHPFGTRRPEVTRLLEPGARTLLMNTLCLVHSRSTSAQAPYDAIPRRTSVESRRHSYASLRAVDLSWEVITPDELRRRVAECTPRIRIDKTLQRAVDAAASSHAAAIISAAESSMREDQIETTMASVLHCIAPDYKLSFPKTLLQQYAVDCQRRIYERCQVSADLGVARRLRVAFKLAIDTMQNAHPELYENGIIIHTLKPALLTCGTVVPVCVIKSLINNDVIATIKMGGTDVEVLRITSTGATKAPDCPDADLVARFLGAACELGFVELSREVQGITHTCLMCGQDAASWQHCSIGCDHAVLQALDSGLSGAIQQQACEEEDDGVPWPAGRFVAAVEGGHGDQDRLATWLAERLRDDPIPFVPEHAMPAGQRLNALAAASREHGTDVSGGTEQGVGSKRARV